MPKLWFVIKREYLTRVLTKGFIISTVAIPAFIIGIIAFQFFVAEKQPAHTQTIAIMDEAGQLGNLIASLLTKQKLPDGKPAFTVVQIQEQPRDPQELRAHLTTLTRTRRLSGYLWIPHDILAGEKPQFVVRNPGAFMTLETINHAVTNAVIARLLQSKGVSVQNLSTLLHNADVRLIHLTPKGEAEEKGQIYAVAIGMATILYGSLLMYGITTMRSVLEEKTTRIMEILISSIQPFELLAGKILGVAAVGLTQFLIWAVSAGLLAAYGLSMARTMGPSDSGFNVHLPPVLLAFGVLYFIGGYFLFASMYAAIGSAVSSEQDAQQLQMPVTLLLVASFFLFSIVMSDPNSPVSIALSMIPFFSPILMVMRIALQTPPLWQIALSLVLLALTTLGVTYASARIYRVGVLMYGKRPSFIELFRWLRYS
jgi:ABC-2 type transport system permease protein